MSLELPRFWNPPADHNFLPSPHFPPPPILSCSSPHTDFQAGPQACPVHLTFSKASCLFSKSCMSCRLEIRWKGLATGSRSPTSFFFGSSTASTCQTTAQDQSNYLLSLHSDPELLGRTGESHSLRGWGHWSLVSNLSWALSTAQRSFATCLKPSTTLLQSLSRQLHPGFSTPVYIRFTWRASKSLSA